VLTPVTPVRFGMHFHTLATTRKSSHWSMNVKGRRRFGPVFPRINDRDEVCPRGIMPRASAGGRPPPVAAGIRIRDSGRPIGIYRPGLITEFYNTGPGEYGSTLFAHCTGRFSRN